MTSMGCQLVERRCKRSDRQDLQEKDTTAKDKSEKKLDSNWNSPSDTVVDVLQCSIENTLGKELESSRMRI